VKVLVLDPGPRSAGYAFFPSRAAGPAAAGRIDGRACSLEAVAGLSPDLIAVRFLHGGEAFTGPTLATRESIAALEGLVPDAPLHLPPAIDLVRACGRVLPGLRVVMLFETSFFAGLPERERLYALDPDAAKALRLRRTGYHGLLHGAACSRVVRAFRSKGAGPAPRILSICLERRPELAAAVGVRPVMVTGGVTPLEGLPGETSCGDLDPGLVVSLGEKGGWGPEGVDALLSRGSGLSALAGRPVTLGEVLRPGPGDLRLARSVFLHRLLLAGGAGVAALGGVDAVVFSGRYAAAAERMGRRLAPRVAVEVFPDPVERVAADAAVAALPGAPSAVPA
jgi:acetate kinase